MRRYDRRFRNEDFRGANYHPYDEGRIMYDTRPYRSSDYGYGGEEPYYRPSPASPSPRNYGDYIPQRYTVPEDYDYTQYGQYIPYRESRYGLIDRDTDIESRGDFEYGQSRNREYGRPFRRSTGYGETYRRTNYAGIERTSSYAGRGPKNWTRSDDRILEDVCDYLERDSDIDASEMNVEVNDGIVTLSGTVEDRYTKRLAEDTVEYAPGVRDIRNNLMISTQQGQGQSTQGRRQETKAS